MDDPLDKLNAQVLRLAQTLGSQTRKLTALQIMTNARLIALEAAVCSAFEMQGFRASGQSVKKAVDDAARAECERQLAEFADTDPELASTLRACIASFLDATDKEQ